MSSELRVHPDVEALSRAAAERLASLVHATVSSSRRFLLALAGGSTPRALYRLLASEYRQKIPWAQVHFFWGDERYVASNHPGSNYRMARETLLDQVPGLAENVHPMPTTLAEPEQAARAYEQVLSGYFPGVWPRFDLVLLGLGADGHTVSLFPGSPALEERKRWVVAARAPAEPAVRLTLTLPAINHARHVYFFVAGAEKAEALRRAFEEPPDTARCPAGAVRPLDGFLVWWVDRGASRLLHPRPGISAVAPDRSKP